VRRMLAACATLVSVAGLVAGGPPASAAVHPSVASRAVASRAVASGAVAGGGTLRPVSPVRVFDTRHGGQPIPARTISAVPVVGQGLVPVSGVAGVVANLTVLGPAKAGSLSVFPGGTGWTGASTMTFPAAVNSQSMVTVPVGADGTLSVRNNGSVGLQLVVDVVGYYLAGSPPAAGGYGGSPLTRVFSARSTPGQRPMAAHQVATFGVAGVGTIPGPTSAVIATITVLTPAAAGSVSVFDPDTGWNGSATVSFARGITFQTQVIGRLSADGRLSVRNNLGVAQGVLVDVTGYFGTGPATQPGAFSVLPETRVLDSRSNLGITGPLEGGTMTTLGQPVGRLPRSDTIAALELNLTVLSPSQSGAISVIGGDEPWNGSTTITFQRGVTAKQTVLVPLSQVGTYRIRNDSGVPVSLIGDVTGYYPAATPLPLETMSTVEGYPSAIRWLSCSTPTSCLAIDQTGHLIRRDASGWSPTVSKMPNLTVTSAVSCVSATWCMVAGEGAEYVDGSTWSSPLPGAPSSIYSLSCTSTTWCLGLTRYQGYGYSIFDGTSWSAPTTMSGANYLRCLSPTSCIAAVTGGAVIRFDGTSWSTPEPTGLNNIRDLDCAAATRCVATDYVNRLVSTYDGTSWTTTATVVPDGTAPVLASCASGSDCFMTDSRKQLYSFDGTSWTTLGVAPIPVLALSCPAAGSCIGLQSNAFQIVTEWTGSAWGAPLYLDWVRGRLVSVSCPSAEDCLVVDSGGGLTRGHGASWSETVDIDAPADRTLAAHSPNVRAIECPTSTDCLVVDGAGQVVRYDGTSWQPPAPVSGAEAGFNDISCASVSFCLAVTMDGKALPYDGQHFGAPVAVSSSALTVSCAPGATTCAVADSGGKVAVYRDGTLTPLVQALDASSASVSCATVNYCLAATQTDTSSAASWNGQRWIPLPRPPVPVEVYGLHCTAVAVCDGVTGSYSLTLFGNTWRVSVERAPTLFDIPAVPHGLACSPDRTCRLAASSYDSAAWGN